MRIIIDTDKEAIIVPDTYYQQIDKKNEENNRNMMELNDYLNNYSSMSFDDYKRIKNQTKNVEHYENS